MFFAIAGLLIAFSLYPLTEVFKPGMLEEEKKQVLEIVAQTAPDDGERQRRSEVVESIYRQPRFSLEQFTSFTSMGLIYSGVCAIFIRYRKPKEQQPEKTS